MMRMTSRLFCIRTGSLCMACIAAAKYHRTEIVLFGIADPSRRGLSVGLMLTDQDCAYGLASSRTISTI